MEPQMNADERRFNAVTEKGLLINFGTPKIQIKRIVHNL